MKKTITFIFILGLFFSAAAVSAEEKFTYNDHGQRDPFWPLLSSGGAIVNYDSNFSVSELVLEGIIADGKSRLAIINGSIVEEGKRLGNYTVQQVLPDSVILTVGSETTVLHLKKEE